MEYIEDAVKGIIIYIIIADIMINLVNDDKYKRYIRMFTGLILIVLVISPILKLTNSIDVLTSNEIDYDKLQRELSINADIDSISSRADKIVNSKCQEVIENDVRILLKKNNYNVKNVCVKAQDGILSMITVNILSGDSKDIEIIANKISLAYGIEIENVKVEIDRLG